MLLVAPFYFDVEAAFAQAQFEQLAGLGVFGAADDLALGILGDGVAAAEYGQRADGV